MTAPRPRRRSPICDYHRAVGAREIAHSRILSVYYGNVAIARLDQAELTRCSMTLILSRCCGAGSRKDIEIVRVQREFNWVGGLLLCGVTDMAFDLSMPILVVDDYSTMIRIIRNLLKQIGFENVDDASDGSAALAKLQTKRYGLVISDWNMEPMTGYDLLKEVRADPNLATTPFIMITAESKTENVIAAKQAGVSNYIVKPFNAATLKQDGSGVSRISRLTSAGSASPPSGHAVHPHVRRCRCNDLLAAHPHKKPFWSRTGASAPSARASLPTTV